MSTLIVADTRVTKFVSQTLGMPLCPPYTCLGIDHNDRIIAGVVFNHFEGADVHFTAAGHGWTREFLRAVGEYVFAQLGCSRMTAITEQKNVVTLGLKLGGKLEGCLRDHFGPGRDGDIIGILRSEYRFLPAHSKE